MEKCIKSEEGKATIGLDLGDKTHYYCMLDEQGEIVEEGKISSTAKCMESFFADRASWVVAMEAGTQSPWISRLLESYGHKVLVGNPRKLKMIYASMSKSDQRDAQMLARIARFDPRLLSPIKRRGPRAQSQPGGNQVTRLACESEGIADQFRAWAGEVGRSQTSFLFITSFP